MPEKAKRIYVGTAGWSYPDWEGAVYPSGKSAEPLQTVARYLDCVEVNSSFYRPPSARTSAAWMRAVLPQPDFRFLVKAWRRFTHERQHLWTPAEFKAMTEGLEPIREAERLETVLFQFPWSFAHNPANLDWLQAIAESFASWPMAVEVRHDSWAGEAVTDWFRARGITYCNIDQPQLNHCLPPTAIATTDLGYFRLHGRNAEQWFRETEEVYGARYDYLYSAAELGGVIKPIKALATKTKKTFVIFNNHRNGKAFANALELKAELDEESPRRAPALLLNRYPALREKMQAEGEEQLTLV